LADSRNVEISRFFDRVVVINLARRPERMERFWKNLRDWPFGSPQRFEAIDGLVTVPPPGWDKGPGAWGCLLSHRAVLDAAIADGINSLLVLEDDAFVAPDFGGLVDQFLQRVPADWDCLMLGAEHLRPPIPMGDGVVRCVASNRSHAYAVRGRFMQILSQFWSQTTNDHCDVVLSSLMRHFKAYAPDPLLIGQDAGQSDVTDRRERLRFLADHHKEMIAQSNPRYALESLLVRLPAKR
jgi:Glycosyltransferase family 25 (LPS biosynthesis protein)